MTATTATPRLDATHEPALRSWVEAANDPASDFPIQNLPFGVFRRVGSTEPPRIGVAIGNHVLDVLGCIEEDLLTEITPETARALSGSALNHLMSQGADAWSAARRAISRLLEAGAATLRDNAALRERHLIPIAGAELTVPAVIGDYTDFYASVHHAMNVGSMFRPDNPLLPNYKHLPVGYHGRASSIVASGTPVRRPQGQTKADDDDAPTFGPSRLLDYELEMGFLIGAGNELGRRITMAEARRSARDIQKWEYQPLGPFNAKNFATTVSPWVVTLDALEPFRVPGPPRDENDPPTLAYLQPAEDAAYDITVEVYVSSEQMRQQQTEPLRVSRGSFRDMYWTIAQMLVHHTSTGCNLEPGDLMASGTISGPDEGSRGCLLERTWRGQNPLELPDGTQRKFLADGDEVVIKAFCEKPGTPRIGFGECRGVILPAD
ncbi:MAG: fumarylacetoacetase [Planctomycetota bacterium]|jgi:fumarylacetoacetase